MSDFGQKMDAVKDALSWAAKAPVFFKYDADGGRVREPNRIWGELFVLSFAKQGTDTVLDVETGDLDNPRQECLVGYRGMVLQLNMRSRKQRTRETAWHGALVTQLRLSYPLIRSQWLTPVEVALLEANVVQDMPMKEGYDSRTEDLAILEMTFSTVITDMDEASKGTWIEQIELSSDMDPLDDSLQLDEELIP